MSFILIVLVIIFSSSLLQVVVNLNECTHHKVLRGCMSFQGLVLAKIASTF